MITLQRPRRALSGEHAPAGPAQLEHEIRGYRMLADATANAVRTEIGFLRHAGAPSGLVSALHRGILRGNALTASAFRPMPGRTRSCTEHARAAPSAAASSAARIRSTSAVSATSCTRRRRCAALRGQQRQGEAAGRRAPRPDPVSLAIRDLRDKPTSSGKPDPRELRQCGDSSCRLCSRLLPKPKPGSSTICRSRRYRAPCRQASRARAEMRDLMPPHHHSGVAPAWSPACPACASGTRALPVAAAASSAPATLQGAHVVEHPRAGAGCASRITIGRAAVDGEHHRHAPERLDNRQNAVELLLLRHRCGRRDASTHRQYPALGAGLDHGARRATQTASRSGRPSRTSDRRRRTNPGVMLSTPMMRANKSMRQIKLHRAGRRSSREITA
jgi:hypothetical protein